MIFDDFETAIQSDELEREAYDHWDDLEGEDCFDADDFYTDEEESEDLPLLPPSRSAWDDEENLPF